ILSNVRDEMSDICEQVDEEDDMPFFQNISTKKKRKRTLRAKQAISSSAATVEIANLQKDFSLYQFKNDNLSNILNSASPSKPPPPPEPEFVLGVDIRNFSFGFDEHTRRIRQIFRVAGYASNPSAVLNDQETVTELKNLMKKRDKALQNDEEALADAWQALKESVRQLKHDDKRNKRFQTIRTSSINTNDSSSSINDTSASS
ncbi:unnamed protein product, partial [Rotaria magnacalcarata]